MSAQNAVERAKAELAEIERKISLLESERSRIEMQKATAGRERDRLKAFLDLYRRFVLDEPAPVLVHMQLREVVEAVQQHAAHIADSPSHDSKKAPASSRSQRKGARSKVTKVDRKPGGLPTMPEMIVQALKVAQANGGVGLEPKDITAYIANRWWPTVKSESVGPIAWRMFSRKELEKHGDLYTLPHTNASAQPALSGAWPKQDTPWKREAAE
jgi:hypothetical protein